MAKKEGTARKVESIQQSSAIPKNKDVGLNLASIQGREGNGLVLTACVLMRMRTIPQNPVTSVNYQ